MKITAEKIMAQRPCSDYTEADVREIIGDGIEHTVIPELPIPVEDQLWALIYVCMSPRQKRHFACDCAERALHRERAAGREPDERSWRAVEVARRYAEGEATLDELEKARDDAWAAAAVADAAAYADYAAYSDADADAADDLAAELQWQIQHALDVIGEGGVPL